MQQAIDYEVQWQIDEIEDGGAIQQATVLFDPDTGETRVDAQQGRRARLPLLPRPRPAAAGDFAPTGSSGCSGDMPELPRAMADRFIDRLRPVRLRRGDADRQRRRWPLTSRRPWPVAGKANAKPCANWVMGDLAARLNKDGREIDRFAGLARCSWPD